VDLVIKKFCREGKREKWREEKKEAPQKTFGLH
jgi:hypothetical protein